MLSYFLSGFSIDRCEKCYTFSLISFIIFKHIQTEKSPKFYNKKSSEKKIASNFQFPKIKSSDLKTFLRMEKFYMRSELTRKTSTIKQENLPEQQVHKIPAEIRITQ